LTQIYLHLQTLKKERKSRLCARSYSASSGNFFQTSSAYEMKNNLCLFERPLKIQKNGVFRFEISFFVLEILPFFYYANQISDDVTLFATKMWKVLSKRYLWKY